MLNFNQKFISIHNINTLQHFAVTIDLQMYTLNLPSTFYTIPHYSVIPTHVKDNNLQQLITHLYQNKQSEQEIKLLNIKDIFEKAGLCIQLCSKKELFIPDLNRYFQFNQLTNFENCLPTFFLGTHVILIRFSYTQTAFIAQDWNEDSIIENKHKKSNHLKSSFQKDNLSISYSAIEGDSIKERDRRRNIGQIMEFVRKWRNIAQDGINGKKLNLQQAAVHVGIPKKSLDDYFYQLRVAEKYNFDFQNNLNKNISFLRRFVKKHIPSRGKMQQIKIFEELENNEKGGQKNNNKLLGEKLPKRLKQAPPVKPLQKKLSIEKLSISNEQSKIRRLSQYEISSVDNLWPLKAHNQIPYDQEDSIFFKDFNFGCNQYVEFNHLIRGNQNQKGNQSY